MHWRLRTMGVVLSLWVAAAMPALSASVRWPQFRGIDGSGISLTSDFPVHFGPKSNVVWQTELPAGFSSPCIWEDRIFLTGQLEDRLETLCLDRVTGRILWRQSVVPDKLEKGGGGSAAPTSATDGSRVCSYFGPFGLVCYDFAGKQLWRKELPTPVTQHGTGTSPVLADGLVVLSRDQDVDSHLLAIDSRDGKTVWRVERPEFRRGFSTPLIWPADRPELIILPGTLRMLAYQLKDGAVRWSLSGLPNEMVTSPTADGGLIYVAGWTHGAGVSVLPKYDALLAQGDRDKDGRLARAEAPAGPAKQHWNYVDANKDDILDRAEWETIAEIFEKSENALLALRPDGQGDVTGTHVVWKQTRGLPYVPSPLYYDGRLYVIKNGGLVSCFEAKTGRVLYQEERVGALGDYYASPVAAKGKVLLLSQNGTAVVLRAGDTLEILARNDLGERLRSTPAIAGDKLYLRTPSRLYAFGE